MLHPLGFDAADHAVVITLEKGIAHSEVVRNTAVAVKAEAALIGEKLLLVVRDIAEREAVILATEIEGAHLGDDREAALQGAKRLKEGVDDMLNEQRQREQLRYAYAEDVEPSVRRS